MTNKEKAERYFIDLGIMPEKKDRKTIWVLHHIDWTMKYTNPERYEQWRIEDLLPMTIKQHQRLHMLIAKINNDTAKYGRPKTEAEKKRISEFFKDKPKSEEQKRKIADSNIGKHDHKGVNNPNYGKKHPGVGGRPKGSPATKGTTGMRWKLVEGKRIYYKETI